MLTSAIPAYLYKQYQDDDDLTAFVAALNAATSTYVAWFASVGLPYYPGLSDGLLDWVAAGIYGMDRPSLVQTATATLGVFNTFEFNQPGYPLNTFVEPTVTYYDISDDVFKRIITWNFYKGDGKRFCMKWLKRRVMRFLAGANGLSPNPLDPSFVIGPENTQAVSATVSGTTLSVAINGPYISSLAQLDPNMLGIFASAFNSGVLDLPAQYQPSAQVVTHLVASVTPGQATSVGITTTQTTGAVTVSAIAGTGALTYAWTWQSGGAGITINSPTLASTSFGATGMARGATLLGIALCTVTDSASNHATVAVSVTMQNVSAPSVHITPSSLSTTITTGTYQSPQFAAVISGGAGPYGVTWSWQSGGAGVNIVAPTGGSTALSVPSIAPGASDSGVLLVSITDAYGQPASATAAVSIARATLVQALASPTSLSASSQTTPITTGSTTVTPSGGQAPYSTSWTFTFTSESQHDGATGTVGSPSSATTNFTASGMSAGSVDSGTAQCVVVDALGQHTTVNVPVSFTYNPPSPVQHLYTSGSGTETAPFTGFVMMEVASPGGGGEGGQYNHSLNQSNGGQGGDSGTYCRSVYAVTVGQTVHYAVGTPGAGGTGGNFGLPGAGTTASVTSGTLSITAMTAPGGNSGNAPSGGNQANITFNAGTAGGLNFAGQGGAPIAGQHVSNYGAGGRGGLGLAGGAQGGGGAVSFYYYV